MKIKTVMYKQAYNQMVRALDLAIDLASKEDRDEDYDKLVDCRYELDELYTIMNEILRR